MTGWCCKFANRPWFSIVLLLFFLLVLFLLRRWLAGLLALYLGLLAVLGMLVLVRLLGGMLAKRCWKASADPKGSGSEGHPPSKAIHLPAHTYKRPDPMIYSQFYLLAKGVAVTWDNPDIQLFDGATPVSSHALVAGKTYRIQARIWNGSTDAPAVNLPVRFHYLTFGVGTTRNYIGQTMIDLPVKGAPTLPVVAEHSWTAPSTAGHFCIQVELLWGDDANPANNLGQENVDVKKLNSPNATFQFALRNDAPFAREFRLIADSYGIPQKPPCPPMRIAADDEVSLHTFERDPFAAHRRSGHPLPQGWRIAYSGGDAVGFEPEEQRTITVHVTARDGFVGRQPLNVNVFHRDELVGGVTLYAES